MRSPAGFLRDVSAWVGTHQAPTLVALFLLFSWLIRYWRARLPAAEQWANEGESKGASWVWLSFVAVAIVAALVLRGSLSDLSLGAFPRFREPRETPDAFLYW